MTHPKFRAVAGRMALVLTIVLAAAACGDDGDRSQAPPATESVDAGNGAGPGAGGDAVQGATLYAASCAACHGANGQGVTGVGPPLAATDFVSGSTDEELIAFLIKGRASDDPANTTGIAMPPRGGNPALTDQDLADIVAYVRTMPG